MTQNNQKLAVLFADVCGSTALYENLGDDLARQLIMRCLDTISTKITIYQGTLIKTIGDEIMCIFPDAEAAFHAACAMQAAVENDRPLDDTPLRIRIGFNYGEVIKESNDVFGNTVNVASRVAAITRAGQIMATQAVFSALPPVLQSKMRQIMRAEFKGKQGHHEVYQVICEQEDTQTTRFGVPAYRKSPDNNDEMILRYHNQILKVNKERRSVALGRGEACDIVIQNDFASRLHSHIELRFGKFIISDQSTNGTYIRFADGNVVHITREEIPFHGNGSISLGQSFTENSTDIVEFSITSTHVQHREAK
jgi:adenylate cyclase